MFMNEPPDQRGNYCERGQIASGRRLGAVPDEPESAALHASSASAAGKGKNPGESPSRAPSNAKSTSLQFGLPGPSSGNVLVEGALDRYARGTRNCAAHFRKSNLKSHAARHQTCIERLEEKEESNLQASLALVVYPVLTLPAEITSRIFVDCPPAHGRIIPSPSTSRPRTDLSSPLAGHSSFHVQAVELHLFNFKQNRYSKREAFPGEDEVSDERARHLLESWISRAKGHPLSLGFDFPSSLQLHNLRTRFPLLRNLTTSHLMEENQHNLLEGGPPIRKFRVLNESFTLNASLPLLTSLEMNFDSMEAFFGILTNFPLPAHLKCGICSEHSDASYALDLVTLPNLCALEIPNFTEREDIVSFVSRSSCAFHCFTFAIYEDVEEEELTGWFQLFPALEALEIRECHDLALLIKCIDSPYFFPNLSGITISSIRSESSPPMDYDVLIDMFRRRSNLRSFLLMSRT
ncbi:hypothetical protein C8R44DRAFT_862886 [Mycena epipterygia]|nr:hypothetical protein C8R44DRAFT_862886 [Mycena epipterygia]